MTAQGRGAGPIKVNDVQVTGRVAPERLRPRRAEVFIEFISTVFTGAAGLNGSAVV